MKCLVIGASAGLGRAVTEELAARGHKLSIVSSDESDLASIAKDLKLRHSTKVSYLAMDLTQINIKSFLRNSVSPYDVRSFGQSVSADCLADGSINGGNSLSFIEDGLPSGSSFHDDRYNRLPPVLDLSFR